MCVAFRRIAALRLFVGAACAVPSAAAQNTVSGAGSTFVEPVLTKWAAQWSQRNRAAIVYEGVGSGAGIDTLKAGRVDFAATDAPLKDDELKAGGRRRFPVVASAGRCGAAARPPMRRAIRPLPPALMGLIGESCRR